MGTIFTLLLFYRRPNAGLCVSSAVRAHCLTRILTLFHTSLRLYRLRLLSLITFFLIFCCSFEVVTFFLSFGWLGQNQQDVTCEIFDFRKKCHWFFSGTVAVPSCPCSPLQRARQVFAEVAGVPSCGQRNCTSCQTFAQKACWLHPPPARRRRASRHFGKQLLVRADY